MIKMSADGNKNMINYPACKWLNDILDASGTLPAKSAPFFTRTSMAVSRSLTKTVYTGPVKHTLKN